MENLDSRIPPSPEPESDDSVSPVNPTPAGAPSDPPGRPPGDLHPRPPDEGDSLISDRLARYVPVATDALGRRRRCDGLTPERQCVFLDALARCGVAADAARAAGVSRDTVYELRNSARGAAFALAWEAAILISRGRMGDELQSRALNGVVERIYRGGELWGERHRHDNRLAMAVLTRLDRQAEGLGQGAATARAIAQEWDQFLDIVGKGGEGASAFLQVRAGLAESSAGEEGSGSHAEAAGELGTSAETLRRLDTYRGFGVAVLEEADISDLSAAAMEGWTEEQWDRADYSGLLDSLDEESWPDAARNPRVHETNGTCRNRQDIDDSAPAASGAEDERADGKRPAAEHVPGLWRLRREYRARFPQAPEDWPDDEFPAWEDEDLGCWMTGHPPPEGFEGHEIGIWGDADYRRALTPEERAAIDACLAAESEADEAERAAALSAARAARDRAFGFVAASASPSPDGEGV